jgi:hypothetical protein
MSLSFETHLDILFCLLSFWFIRLLTDPKYDSAAQPVAADAKPARLAHIGGWDLESPVTSATIPSITVSPALSPIKENVSVLDKLDDQIECRAVSFAARAIIVEDIEPPSTSASDAFSFSENKAHRRRASEEIKIDSVLAQAADDAKHTLKARPLTPFIKWNGVDEDDEEPLTGAVGAEFEVKDISSVTIGKSIEGGATMEVRQEINSLTFAKEEDTIAQPLLAAKV